jgi:hypothetical protein
METKYNNVEMSETGLKCDNPNCDWKDETITFENYHEWLNKACPKCGENVLTEQDYNNAQVVRFAADLLNNLSPEELVELSKKVNVDDLKSDPIFSETVGFENLTNDTKLVSISVSTHKEIRVDKIKPCNE